MYSIDWFGIVRCYSVRDTEYRGVKLSRRRGLARLGGGYENWREELEMSIEATRRRK